MLHKSAFGLTRAPGLGQNDTESQYLGGLGDELGECSSEQQPVEQESGKLTFLLGEPLYPNTDGRSSCFAETGRIQPAKHSGKALAASCPACGRVPPLCAPQKVGP